MKKPVQKSLTLPPGTPAWQIGFLASGKDPYVFVTEVLGVLPFGKPNPGNVPQIEKWQDEALKAIRDGKLRISIRSGHGVGKGALFAWLVLWGIAVHTEVRIPVTANSQDQLRDNNWPEIMKWHEKLPEGLRDQIVVEKERVYKKVAPGRAFATARTASKSTPEALQGIHAEKVIFLLDEASGIPDIVFEVAQGSLSTPGAIVVLASNPTKRSGFFYDTHTKLSHLYHCIRVNCEDVPRARHHIELVVATYGKTSNKYRVRVLGEFPEKDDDVVIPMDLVRSAILRQVWGFDVFPVWGVDVARFGDDATALAKRRGNHLLERIPEWRNMDGIQVTARIVDEFWKTPEVDRPKRICVDVIGYGASVVDQLKLSKLPNVTVVPVNVAESAANAEHCHRKRDELWWEGRKWFEARDCFIPDDPVLIEELTTPTYDFTAAQKVLVESKDEMKKRTGVKSPNKADAFLLTFAVRDEPRVGLWDRHKRKLRDNDNCTHMAA